MCGFVCLFVCVNVPGVLLGLLDSGGLGGGNLLDMSLSMLQAPLCRREWRRRSRASLYIAAPCDKFSVIVITANPDIVLREKKKNLHRSAPVRFSVFYFYFFLHFYTHTHNNLEFFNYLPGHLQNPQVQAQIIIIKKYWLPPLYSIMILL